MKIELLLKERGGKMFAFFAWLWILAHEDFGDYARAGVGE